MSPNPGVAVQRAHEIRSSFADWDQVMGQLRQEGFSKAECTVATSICLGLSLGEAKQIVHQSRAWQDVKDHDERLHDQIDCALGQDLDSR